MNERPILFSGPMVRAILENRKTMTRRVMKPQPELKPGTMISPMGKRIDTAYWHWRDEWWWQDPQPSTIALCPYGPPGTRLWVRETWQAQEPDGNWWHQIKREDRSLYNWAWTNPVEPAYEGKPPKWLPAIHMPRWASRLTLEITSVKVERVQDISEDDARAEGVQPRNTRIGPLYKPEFVDLWDSINGTRPGCSWSDNPWCWVLSFKRVLR